MTALRHKPTRPATRLLAALVGLSLLAGAPARAQVLEDKPEGIQGVGIDDNSGAQIPLDLRFRDENGKAITLAEIFSGDRPVLLSLNYSDCPMLCTLQLSGLVTTLRELEWTAGREFDVISVSVDPLETTVRAKQTEQRYLKQYNRPGAAEGFRFLTGNQKSIRKLADTVGFRYKYLPDKKEFSHTATEIVCSPTGMVSRYLNGVAYDPDTVRLSLVEASEGKVGTVFDSFFLYCFHYDETEGRYGPVARRIMSVGAGVTIFALAVGLIPYWLRRTADSEAVAATQPVAAEPLQKNTPPAEPEPIEVA